MQLFSPLNIEIQPLARSTKQNFINIISSAKVQ